jgi:hypothetical protein
MTGTLFELFDAMRTGAGTDLRIVRAPRPLPSPVIEGGAVALAADDWRVRQRDWLDRLLESVGRRRTILEPLDEADFDLQVKGVLCDTFGVGRFDPRRDEGPGLEALSDDRASLLFGRASLIAELERRVLANGDALTLLVGVSGAGKSSLLRAGLMGEWFRAMPRGAALARGATAVLFEPALLQLRGGEDPLESFAAALSGGRPAGGRVIGPLPFGFAQARRAAIPPPTGDAARDAAAALDWWERAVPGCPGPVVLIVDQAEQVEAIARAAAEREAQRTGADAVGLHLSPGWLRFTALIALLTGVADAARLGREQVEKAAAMASDHRPVRVILGLHRVSAIDLWPIDPLRRPAPFEVPPITEEEQFRLIIDGTLRAFGLVMEQDLLDKMKQEARALAIERQRVAEQAGVGDGDARHESASVLPLVVTALQRTLMLWRERHGEKASLSKADMTIGPRNFAYVSGIADSVESLGEDAWAIWQARLAEEESIDLTGPLSRRDVEAEQSRRFSRLMGGLVDVGNDPRKLDRQDLAYLSREGSIAREQAALVEALRRNRLLTTVGGQWLRLPHRSILEHWSRARDWLTASKPRLELRALLKR